MNVLTPIQRKVLEFIVQEVRQHSLSPTHREISAAFAWRSNAAAKCHLLALEKKGFIRTRTRISRGIEIKPAALQMVPERARAQKDFDITPSGRDGHRERLAPVAEVGTAFNPSLSTRLDP